MGTLTDELPETDTIADSLKSYIIKMGKLTDKELLEADYIISDLLESYLVRDKDKASQRKYNFLVRPEVREFISEILLHSRRELVVDENKHFAFTRKIGDNDREFRKDETIILLRLRQSDDTRTSLSQFPHVRFEDLYDIITKEDGRKISEKAVREILKKFQRLNLIKFDEDITVYPSIYAFDNDIQNVNSYLEALERKNDKSEENEN